MELTPSKKENLDNAELLAKGVIFMPLRPSSLRNFATVHFFRMLCFSATTKRGKGHFFLSFTAFLGHCTFVEKKNVRHRRSFIICVLVMAAAKAMEFP